MIDSETGIEAYVQKYQANDHYKEYKASSESPFYTGNSNECYIEAITGERFQIGVVVPKFNFKGYSHIEVTWDIDGGSVDCSSHFEKPRKRNVVLEPMFDEYIGKVAGETRSIGLSFGEVQRSEAVDHHADQEELERAKRGVIVVTIQRGTMEDVDEDMLLGDCKLLPKETSKKVAVDYGKSHSYSPVVLEAAPAPQDYWFEPATGKSGKKITFTFFYASKMILELKKIIPTEPNIVQPAVPTVEEASSKPGTDKSCSAKQIECRDADDDEVTIVSPPKVFAKRVKTEPAEDEVVEIAPEHATKRMKTEDAEGRVSASPASGTPARTVGTATPAAQDAKARRKRKLELQLEEIKIKRELLELEDGE